MADVSKTKKLKIGSLELVKAIRCLPFTLIMIAVLIGVSWWTNSTFQELTRLWINRLGFAPRDLWLLRWERLILSALVTGGGVTFWLALAMVAFTSGVAEWYSGTLRTALTFWGVHLVTMVLESLIFTLRLGQPGFVQERALFYSRDIGPSAGYMGCLGLITTFLPKPWRWLAFGIVMAYLVVALFFPPGAGISMAIKVNDDLAHLIAYPLGFASAYLFEVKRNSKSAGGSMSEKSIIERMFIKQGDKFLLVNPPKGYIDSLGSLPPGTVVLDETVTPVGIIQVFVTDRAELEAMLPRLKALMTPKAALWVTYHKGTSKVKTDINRDTINAYAQTIGLVGVAMISIDDDWAALRLKQV